MFCVYIYICHTGRFWPTPCRLQSPPGQPQPSPNFDGQSRWGIRTTWSWPGTGPKTSRRNLLGKTVIFLEKNTTCVSNSPELSHVSFWRGSTVMLFGWHILWFLRVRVFAESSYGIIFVGYIRVRILYLCNIGTSILNFEGHSLITVNVRHIRPNMEGSAQLLDSGDLIFHLQGKDSRYERVYSVLCWIRITLWLVNLTPPEIMV